MKSFYFARISARLCCVARTLVLIAAASAVFLSNRTSADTWTWIGLGPNDDWNTPGNWNAAVAPNTSPPFFGQEWRFVFTGSRTTSNIDQAWTVTDVEISSGVPAMTFTGSALTFIKDSSGSNPEGIFNNDNSTQTFSNSEIIFGQNGNYDITATGADIDINAKITINAAVTLDVGGANDVFFDGGIVGGATVNKSGAGELRLRDNSTGITNLNISGGQVLLSQTNNPTIGEGMNVDVSTGATFNMNGNSTNIDRLSGDGSVNMGSGTLTFGDTVDFEWGGVISGNGGVIIDKTAVVTISGGNSYTGATTINSGTLRTDGNHRISNSSDIVINQNGTFDLAGNFETVDSIQGSGDILLGNGGTLQVDETSGFRTLNGDILATGGGTLRKLNGGTLRLSGTTHQMTLLDVDGGQLWVDNASGFGQGTVEISGGQLWTLSNMTNARSTTINDSASTINVSSGTTLTQTGAISGSGTLNKHGSGVLQLNSTSNSYTGDTNILAGTVRLGANNVLPNASDVIVGAFTTLDLNSRSDTVKSLSGDGNVITGNSAGRLTVNQNGGSPVEYGGVISGSGGLTKSGTHTLILTGNNNYLGSTSITGGVLQLGAANRISDDSDVSISGGTFDLNDFNERVDSIVGSGGTVDLGSATLTVDDNSGNPKAYDGNIIGTGSFVKSGAHALMLTGNNTYDGTTTLDAGILRVAGNNNLGDGALIFDSGSLNTTASFTNSRTVTINAGDSANFEVNTGTTLTQTGGVNAGSTTTLVKLGGGTFAFNSSNGNNFVGDISVNAGTLSFGSGDTVGNATDVSVTSGATFSITQTEGIDSLSGFGNVTIASGQLLEVGLDNASALLNGDISGTSGQFGKAGSGVMTLAGNNTYSGATTITGGTLRLLSAGRLSDSTDVSVSAGATFDVNDVSDAIDGLSGAGSVTLGTGTTANSLTVGANNGSGTFTGTITESGSFIKIGSGTQTLSNTGNNWNNGTQILGGTLRIGSDSHLGSGGITINGATLEVTGSTSTFKGITLGTGGGTIDVNSGQTYIMNFATPISGNGNLTKTDTGTFQTRAAHSYSGDTNINAGTLLHDGTGVIGGDLPDGTNVSIAAGATWDLSGFDDTVTSVFGSGNIRLGGATLTVTQDGGSRTISGNILEDGGITKNGTHTLTLLGLNDYKGDTAINDGVLSISENFHLGDPSPSGNLVFGGGTLRITDNAVTFSATRDVTLNSGGGTIRLSDEGGVALTIPGVISGVGGITINADNEEQATFSGVNTYAGGTRVEDATLNISQNANLGANGGALTLDGGILIANASFTNEHAIVLEGSGFIDVATGTLTQSAGISGAGTLSIGGPGTMLLTEPATHAGNTTVHTNATLRFGSGELPDSFDVTVNGLWDLNGVSDTIDGLFGSGTIQLGGATLTVGNAGGDGNFSGSIQEAGGFTKTGFGTQTLSGANTYAAATTIDGGTLEITNNSSLGALSATLAINDSRLRSTSTFTTGRTTTISGNAQIEPAAGTTLTFTSPIDGGNADLAKPGSGTLELTASNTYTGQTEIFDGTLRLSGGGLLSDLSSVSIDAPATFDVTDIIDAIGGLTGAGDVLLGQGTLTIGANDFNHTFSGVISGDIANNAGTIIKVGAGTQTFSGVNLYAGGTEINDGTLRISADANLGAAGSDISYDGGTLNATDDITTVRLMSVGAGGGTIEVNDATTLQSGGSISGAGVLNKTGDGTLVLTGVSSYLSGTNILGGVISVPFDFNLGANTGQLTLDGGTLNTTNFFNTNRLTTLGAGGGTFDVDGSTTLTHSGAISGAGNLTKQGDGVLALTTANAYDGNTRLFGGILRVNESSRLGVETNFLLIDNGTLHLTGSFANNRLIFLGAAGGTIDIDGGNSLTQFGQIRNAGVDPGALTKNGGGTLTLAAANTYSGPTNINSGIVRLNQDHALDNETDVNVAAGATFDVNNMTDSIDALSGDGDVLLGSGNLIVGANDGSGTFMGVISGAGGLTKVGAGTQSLRTKIVGEEEFPNTYAGGTAINGGALDIEHDDNLGDPAGGLSFNAGTLQVSGEGGVNTIRPVTLNSGGGTINTVGEDAAVDFSGIVSGVGSLTKTGQGRLTLSANNTYAGNTTINQGLVRLDGAGRLPDTTQLTVDAATVGANIGGFDLNDLSDAIDGLEGSGDIDLGSGTLTVGAAGGNGDFNGSIEGTGSLVKTGAGDQILAGASTYTGGTAINGGNLEINADNRLGDPAGPLSFDGGTLATSNSFTISRATTISAGGGTFNVFAGNTLTFSSQISGVGGLGKTNSGTLLLTAVNAYTGPTTIDGGTLRINSIERLANDTDVTVNAPGVFDLDNNNETVDGLSGNGSVLLGAARLTIGSNGGDGDFSGVVSGTGSLTKLGAGAQVFSGQNTYSGDTQVDGGVFTLNAGGAIDQSNLFVGFNNGSDGNAVADGAGTTWDLSGNVIVGNDGAGRLDVNNGAVVTVAGNVTLGAGVGSGIVRLDGGTLDNASGSGLQIIDGALQGHGNVLADIVNQDTVSPGASAGILNVTGMYVQDNAGAMVLEVGGADNSDPNNPQFDLLNVSGTAALGGTLELGLLGFAPAPADTFTVIQAGALGGTFLNVADGARLNISSGGTGSFQVDYTATSLVLSDFQGTANVPGDFDNDGDVDAADLAEWESNFGATLAGNDFLDWQRAFNPNPTLASSQGVPEPTTVMLLFLMASIAAISRR